MPRHAISDHDFDRIKPLLPGQAHHPGRTARDNRLFLDAVLWIDRTGAPWRDLPEHFGPWNSAYRRFRRWAEKGVWEKVFAALQETDCEWVMLDSTTIRAHQHAAGQKSDRRARRPRAQPGRLLDQAARGLRRAR